MNFPLVCSLLAFAIVAFQKGCPQFIDRERPDYHTWLEIEDFTLAEHVILQDHYLPQKPWLSEDKFEGDIDGISTSGISGDLLQKNAVRSEHLVWPEGKIPYTISSQYNPHGRAVIAAAMQEFSKKSCIKFVPRVVKDEDYLHIYPGIGCFSLVGRIGGEQRLSLGDGCLHRGIVMHELMHSVGFFHEQSRTDRDEYVEIVFDNIPEKLWSQFRKYSQNEIQYLKTEYDYASLMHYGSNDFSKNNLPTIIPKQPGTQIGQRRDFSTTDTTKLNRLYQCPGYEGALGKGAAGAHKCVDKMDKCPTLAEAGGCKNSASWVREWCPKSCRECTSLGGELHRSHCKDQNGYCEAWYGMGYCQHKVHRRYMTLYCRKSCNLC